ncbi:MAG: DNA topoisomerase IV subunit A [Gemmatimonadetes bacterium]|nr:DNA topoisomerase IV subunit A [Gemmatimonadota bacterium]
MAYADTLFEDYYLKYASYFIKDRAIPEIDDGLKPVQRRILHTLFEMDDGKFHKVANVVGQTMRYHPHGDQSIFGSLVNLANKDMFIEKQGNFGSTLTGDPASAARYIECRLTPLAKEVLHDPEITEYVDSYDGRNREPVAFPAKIPVLLAMGAEGIASSMATRILPHNLIELMEAQIACLRNEPFEIQPDFPTGGLVDVSEYNDGNGKVMIRAQLDVKDPKRIVIRQLPFGSTTESLIASIEAAAKKNKLKIAGISDFTADEVEIEIRLARGVHSEETVDALYAFTDCESSISTNVLVIRAGHPCLLPVSDVLRHNTQRLLEVLEAELKIERKQLHAKLRAKTLEQLFIKERIYKRIEEVREQDKIHEAIRAGFEPFESKVKELTSEDIDTLLKVPIRRISLYDINRANEEMKAIRNRLREIRDHLGHLSAYAITLLEGLIGRYRETFPRRTTITAFKRVDAREAAQRNLALKYDRSTGYLGYGLGSGDTLFDVSPYDRVLVIRKTGAYALHDEIERLFVDKGMLYCGFVDPDLVFTMIYRDRKGHPYVKRCKLDKFILNRGYELVPEGCRILQLTTDTDVMANLTYKPTPRMRVFEEAFDLSLFPVRGNRAKGIRLAPKALKGVRLTRKPEQAEPTAPPADPGQDEE